MVVQTTTIDVPTDDGTADAILAAPVAKGPYPGVLLYMDAFGLRPRLQEMAERLAGDGYVVLVPNVFYRSGRAPLIDLDGLADPENRGSLFAALRPMMQALTPDRVMRDADAYLACLTGDDRTGATVGTTGYCMGGALSLRTAARSPATVLAAASFHGARLATDDAASPHLLADQIRAEVYVAHADHDKSMPPDQQRRLEDALTTAGVRHRTELYDGAPHGFTMSDTPAYDEAATERHWKNLLDLFGRNLTR